MPIGVMSAASLLALALVTGRAIADATPTISACPPAVRAGTACYVGQDTNRAHYLIAIPENWNRVLVMHARGGPYREHLGPKRSDDDATRRSCVRCLDALDRAACRGAASDRVG